MTEPCAFPGCDSLADHHHHITYRPPVTKWLCRQHHEDITIINGVYARRGRWCKKLSNKFRWWIWSQWTKGKIQPKRTAAATAYVNKW